MKALAWVVVVAGIVGVWQLGGKLSPDALAMLTGLIFGGLVAVPTALLVVYTVKNSEPPPQRRDVHIITSDNLSRRLLE